VEPVVAVAITMSLLMSIASGVCKPLVAFRPVEFSGVC
jgi:hypothetical protein